MQSISTFSTIQTLYVSHSIACICSNYGFCTFLSSIFTVTKFDINFNKC
jgi:hypothetical protein